MNKKFALLLAGLMMGALALAGCGTQFTPPAPTATQQLEPPKPDCTMRAITIQHEYGVQETFTTVPRYTGVMGFFDAELLDLGGVGSPLHESPDDDFNLVARGSYTLGKNLSGGGEIWYAYGSWRISEEDVMRHSFKVIAVKPVDGCPVG